MTNDSIRRRFDAFVRIEGFGAKYPWAAGSRGAALFAAIGGTVAGMRTKGAEQLSGAGRYHGGTDAKLSCYAALKDALAAIRDTAVSIAGAEDTPDFDDRFRMPRSSGYDALLTAARAFLKDATPHEALFLEFEMPAGFLDALAADIAALESATSGQSGGLGEQVGGTASLDALSEQGMKTRKQLQAIVRNKFRTQPGPLAEWETAQHIESAPEHEQKPAPPP